MKRFLKTVSAFILALSMMAIPVNVQADHNGGGRQSHFSSGNRPSGGNSGNSSRPSHGNGNGPSRPGGGNRPGGNNRPGDRPGNNGGGNRPGNNGGHRPGGGNRPGDRPGNRPGDRPGNRPGDRPGNHRPGHPGDRPGNHRPGRPGHPAPPPPHHRPHYHGSRPYRHPVPFFGHYHRPVPPPAWRPVVYGPSFGTILGVALGTSLNITLNALANQGYTVASYGDDVVYLNNVPQMNYYWPDAALYYNNGALYGSSFTYPATYYDMSRYNALYSTLCRQYGAPVQTVNRGGVVSATWFGYDNRFVTLEFNSSYGGNFYTTLSFGM